MKMKQTMSLFVLLVLLLAPSAVYAHTGLQSSSPANGTTVSEPLNEIRMVFNTEIGSLSSFELRAADGASVKIADRKVDGATMSGKPEAGLADGEYTVVWKIVGRDGHPVENKFAFTMKASGQNQTQQPPAQSSQSADPVKQPGTAVPPEKADGPVLVMGAVIVLVAVILIAVLVIFKLKKGSGRT